MAFEKLKKLKCNKQLFKKLLKFAFSSMGLTFLGPLYIVAGAFLFIAIEKGPNMQIKEAVAHLDDWLSNMRANMSGEISADLAMCRDDPESCDDTFPAKINKWLLTYQTFFKYSVMGSTSYNGYRPDLTVSDWTFQSALLYTLSIITTIGYGNVKLSTETGHIAVMIYSVFAIPLLTMWLGSIAELLNVGLSFLYYKLFCGFCAKERIKTTLKRPKASRAFQTDWPLNKTHHNEDETISDEETDDVEIIEEEELPNSIPIALVLCVLMAYMIWGILVLAYWTGDNTSKSSLWSLVESGYFLLISLTTIGFGDYYPIAYGVPKLNFDTGCQLLFSTVYIIVGLALMSVFVQSLAERISNIKVEKEETT